jgi:hypothetical protein
MNRVLHVRQLCEIVLYRGTQEDDVKLIDLVPEKMRSEEPKVLVEKLRTEYGGREDKLKPRWMFNKLMLHPTTERADSHNYEPALAIIEPPLQKIVVELGRIDGHQFDRSLRAELPIFSVCHEWCSPRCDR